MYNPWYTTAGQKKKFFVAGHVVPFSVPLDIVIAQRAAGSLLTLRPHTQAYLPSVRGCAVLHAAYAHAWCAAALDI